MDESTARLDKPAVWGSVGRDKTDLSFSPRAAGLVIIFAKSNAWGSTFVCGLNRTELHSTLLQGTKIHSVTKHTYSICIQSVEPEIRRWKHAHGCAYVTGCPAHCLLAWLKHEKKWHLSRRCQMGYMALLARIHTYTRVHFSYYSKDFFNSHTNPTL